MKLTHQLVGFEGDMTQITYTQVFVLNTTFYAALDAYYFFK